MYKIWFSKLNIDFRPAFRCRRTGAAVLTAAGLTAGCAMLVSGSVVSSTAVGIPGALPDVAMSSFVAGVTRDTSGGHKTASTEALARALVKDRQAKERQAAKRQQQTEAVAQTSVVTHYHSRIVPALGSGNFSEWSLSAGSLKSQLVAQQPGKHEYINKTYRHTIPAVNNNANSIELVTTTPMFKFEHVGFPHIETSRRKSHTLYKPYTPLLKVKTRKDGSRYGIPAVRCHGYSPERTEARAARYERKIIKYASHYNVDFHLVKAVIAQESCFRNHAVSPAGAVGLMQLMPATAKWLGVTDKRNSTQNLKAGIRYLAQLTRRFETSELALAAYNAGPANVERYSGVPPFKETQKYVKRVLQNYHSYVATAGYNAAIEPELL